LTPAVKIILGCIADDYTGASDLANTLTRCGLRTVADHRRARGRFWRCLKSMRWVSLKSRSIEAGLAVSRSRSAEKWLRGRGASHVPVQDMLDLRFHRRGQYRSGDWTALRARCRDAIVLVTPAFPENRRTVYMAICSSARCADRKALEGPSAQPDA